MSEILNATNDNSANIPCKSPAPFPTMLTIRETAARGILPEHTLRLMAKAGQLPCIQVGDTKKILINFERLCEQLANLQGVV